MRLPQISLKQINKLAIPAIFAGIVEPLISISDTVIAGHLSNSAITLGAVGLVGAFISALIWIFAQTKSAISAYISQAFGANRVKKSYSLFQQLLFVNLIFSLVITFITYYFSEDIFYLQNARKELLYTTTQFYDIRVFGLPFTLLTFTIFGFFRGLQNTLWAMLTSIFGGSLNIILNYIFAIVLDMGIVGIAYASLIAQFSMFIIALFFLFSKTDFRFTFSLKIHSNFKGLMQMSGNLFIRAFTLNITFWIANYFATSYGNTFLSAHTALVQIWLFSAFFLDGYANAANAISGKLLGKKQPDSILLLSKKLTTIMIGIASLLMGAYSLFYFKIGGVFTSNQEIISIFNIYFWLVILMQPINAIAFLYDGIYKGLGEAKFLRNILLMATFLGFIPLILLLNYYNLQLYAVWIALFFWMILRTIPLYVYLPKILIKH